MSDTRIGIRNSSLTFWDDKDRQQVPTDFLTDGVADSSGSNTDCQVLESAVPAMSVRVLTGNLYLSTLLSGNFRTERGSILNEIALTIAPNSSGSNRVDAIIFRVNANIPNAAVDNVASAEVILGSGVSALSDGAISTAISPDNFYRLADITVADAAATILDVNITDTRETSKIYNLKNVDNFATASQAEAEAGTATDKFMTPERTADAIAIQAGGISNDAYGAAWSSDTSGGASRASLYNELNSRGVSRIHNSVSPEVIQIFDEISAKTLKLNIDDTSLNNGLMWREVDGVKTPHSGKDFYMDSALSANLIVENENTIAGSTFSYSLDVSAQMAKPMDIVMKPDGTHAFILDNTTGDIFDYILGTPGQLSTASYTGKSLNLAAGLEAFQFDSTGTRLYSIDSAGGDKVEYRTLSIAWDIASTVTLISSNGPLTEGTGKMYINQDGTKFVHYRSSYTLSTPFDTDSYTLDKILNGATFDSGTVSQDETKLFKVNQTTHEIEQYYFSEKLRTILPENAIKYDISAQSLDPENMDILSDFSRFYVCDSVDVKVHEFLTNTQTMTGNAFAHSIFS